MMIPSDPTQTHMFAEAAEASAVVARQLAANAALMTDLAARLKRLNPHMLFTCARGSSDHAATFAKYLFETQIGLPTLSQAPSISSIYGDPLLHMAGQPFILVSQSGRSPDLLLSAEAAKRAGALVIALVNDATAPLADLADIVVPLHAGPETSIAATKSYIASLTAFAQLGAAWTADAPLAAAVEALPQSLADAWGADWSAGAAMLRDVRGLFVLGRGLTLGVAQEAALKFKETCGLHGEAFSIAEVVHGPMALVGPDFPVLVLPPLDRARAGLDAVLDGFAARRAPLAMAGGGHGGATELPLAAGLHPVTAPIAMVQSFYKMANALSVARGYDPDHPPLLQKVTETR
jgi:glutamine---fructose-6-phosphate transaminase (isomerizing)